MVRKASRISGADPGFSEGGAPTYDFVKICEKLHEIQKIWAVGGSATVY